MNTGNRGQVSTTRSDAPPGEGESDPATLRSRIHRQCAAIKRRELETATEKLNASTDLSTRERAVIEEMADRIVARLLAPPTAALDDAERNVGSDDVAAIARLFERGDDRAIED